MCGHITLIIGAYLVKIGINLCYFSKINLVAINCIKSKLSIENNLILLIDKNNMSSSKICLRPKFHFVFHFVTTYFQFQINFAVEK